MTKLVKRNITRVNMNLPSDLVEKVKGYANSLGLPITQAYTVLINMALEQKEVISSMPKMIELIKKFDENEKEN